MAKRKLRILTSNFKITPLSIRELQECRYTVFSAQEAAEGNRFFSEEELLKLNRYARWHFNRDFSELVEECLDMEAETAAKVAAQ